MTDTARALLLAALLAGSGLTAFVWRLVRIDPTEPARLIGELRFAHWMGLILAGTGGAWVGLAAARHLQPLSSVDLTIAIGAILLAAWTLHRETRSALMILSVAFLTHAIVDTAHRDGWLAADSGAPLVYTRVRRIDLYLSALCFWIQRR